MICFSFCQISWFSSPHFTNFTFFDIFQAGACVKREICLEKCGKIFITGRHKISYMSVILTQSLVLTNSI